MLIKLDSRNQAHQKFLYELHSERYEYEYTNIPHLTPKSMPTFEQHIKILQLKPYKYYYIYMEDYTYKGAVYLKDDHEIGIFIQKKYLGNQCGEKCLIEFLKNIKLYCNISDLTATVNINNKASNKLFEKLGFKHVGNLYGMKI